MISFFDVALITALLLPIVVVATEVVCAVNERKCKREQSACVERIVAMVVAQSELCYDDISLLHNEFSTRTIGRAMRLLTLYIYGCALDRLRFVARYACKRGDDCRGCELCSGENSIQAIAQLDRLLSIGEVAREVKRLLGAGRSIAYTPLLMSQNRNLQFVGIYLCLHFQLTDSEKHLQRLVMSADSEIAYVALLALCSIRGDLTSSGVCSVMRELAPHHRALFVRHAVQSCYSLRSCAHLLNSEERADFFRRVSSYKCTIVCN